MGSAAAAPRQFARTARLVGAFALVAVVVLAAGSSPGGPPPASTAVELTYASPSALRAALVRHPAALVQDVRALGVAEVQPPGDASRYIRSLRGERGIIAAHRAVPRTEADAPGLTLGVVSTPAGGAYEWQWYATGVDRVPAAILAAAERTTIAIVDTGAELSAPALAGKVRASYDVRTGTRAVGDASGHGTFVASIAGGSTADGGAVAGFGGAARLLIVKVGDGTSVSDVDVAAGIVRSLQNGARIVNVSLAGRTRSAVEASAVAYATRHGVLVVAAAGNDALAGNPLEYPAALLRPVGSNGAGSVGLAVGASGMDGRRAPFSEHGSFLSLAAPGTAVFGAVASTARASLFARVQFPGGGAYGLASGTSYAAPQVAGAAALVWAANPRLTAQQVAAVLEQTASGHGAWSPELGYGVLDVSAAVDLALRLAS